MDLKKAIEKRDNFLKEHPHLQEYQNYIDSVLSKCTNQNDRLIAIMLMLNGKLNELENMVNDRLGNRR